MYHKTLDEQMDNESDLIKICDALMEQIEPCHIVQNSIRVKKNSPTENQTITINRLDIENLSHFVQIWTDILEIDEVNKQFKMSDFQNVSDFEKQNNLYHVGIFYVKINPNVSPLEFFGLLSKISWENLRLSGMNQIPYVSITQLFGEKNTSTNVAIQLMVLGDFFKFWILINPYRQMTMTNNFTKLLLSSMGNLSLYISPNFIKNCQQLIENVEFTEN